jgi:hypothetical protein
MRGRDFSPSQWLWRADRAIRQRARGFKQAARVEEIVRNLAQSLTIGFESEIYDYSCSEATVDAKIRHDRGTVATLARWGRKALTKAF